MNWILITTLWFIPLVESRLSFSSTHDTQQLLALEIKFAEALLSIPNPNPDFKALIDSIYPKTLLKDLQAIDPRAYASHPINAVAIAQRTGWLVQELIPWISEWPELTNMTSESFPTLEDYYEACSSLGLLIETYRLNLKDLSKSGRIHGHKSLRPPNWSILMNTGISTFNRGWLDIGITLMEEGLSAFTGDPEEYSTYAKELKISKETHDNILEKRGPFQESHRCFMVPFSKQLRKKKKYREALRSKSYWYKASLEEELALSHSHDSSLFHQMCRQRGGGDSFGSPLGGQQRCFLIHNDDPFHRLGPFPMELLSESPFIVIFKDFITSKEARHFVDRSSGKLHRSRTGSSIDSTEERMGYEGQIRTSKQTWIQDSTFNISQFLTKEEIQMITSGKGRPDFPANYEKYLLVQDKTAYK
ncbi:Uncharacterized protein FKW44_023575, partial [Caligus rogercresseyi]